MHDDQPATITVGADVFYKVSVTRGKIATGLEHLTVHLPGDHAFSRKFATIAPGQTATLTVQGYHLGDTADLRVLYKGVVRSVAFSKDMSKSSLSLVPISEAFTKQIPERTFQASCNNILFDSNCKISAGLYSYAGTVSVVSGNTITVPGLTASKGNDWSTAGFVAYDVLDYRLILLQSSDVLTLALPFYETVMNENVTVYAGCNRTIGVCNTKFSNTANFGGCPYVPTKNIFTTGL
jgi:uncharacterized phage protein (TIGR02218 family)